MIKKTLAIMSVGLLAGCAPGLLGGGQRSHPHLDRVLLSAADTPAKQGFLFVAMQDAEVALQSAGRALVSAEVVEAKGAVGNVLHAIDPEFPPTPTVTSTGIAPFWPATGYGYRRAVRDIAEQMQAVRSAHGAQDAVVAQTARITDCAEETLARADRVISLGQQAIAAGSADEMEPLLVEISRLSRLTLEGRAEPDDDARPGVCSLEQAKAYLDQLAQRLG